MSKSQENKKLGQLVDQVKTLSKIVDQLQEEVDAMKLKTVGDKNKKLRSNLKEPKITDSKPKSSPFERLRFFNRNNQTSEKSSTVTSLGGREKNVKDSMNPNLQVKNNRLSQKQSNVIRRHKKTNQDVTDSNKHKNKSRSQVNNIDENSMLPEIVCSIEAFSIKSDDSIKYCKGSGSKSMKKTKSSCEGCGKRKKPKFGDYNKNILKQKKGKCPKDCAYRPDHSNESYNKKISKRKKGKCAKDSPYLSDHSNGSFNRNISKRKNGKCAKDCPYLFDHSNELIKFSENKISDDVQTFDCTINKNQGKRLKNKKIMVNLKIDSIKNKPIIESQNNKNSLFDCNFLEQLDFSNIKNFEDTKGMKEINLIKCNEKLKVKKKKCKYCSKVCKTKNVLKINNAILTQDPPMILLSPKTEQVYYCKKKPKTLKINC